MEGRRGKEEVKNKRKRWERGERDMGGKEEVENGRERQERGGRDEK